MKLTRWLALFGFLFLPGICAAQGVPFPVSPPAPNAQMTVCNAPAIGGTPCTNRIQIYGDVALTQPISQPVLIGPTGSYTFFYNSSSAPIQVQITGRPDQVVPGGSGGGGGAGTVTSIATTSPITGGTITTTGTIACGTCVTASGGGSISLAAGQVGFGTGTNAIGGIGPSFLGSPSLFWDNTNGILNVVSSAADSTGKAAITANNLSALSSNVPEAGIIGSESAILTTPTSGNLFGVQGTTLITGGQAVTGVIAGMDASASESGASQTAAELTGFLAEGGSASTGATATNSFGFHAKPQAAGGTLNAAFFADNQTTGATNYAFYSLGGKVHSVGPIDSNGSISANSDGTHAGEMSLLGNTTAPTIPANSFGLIGPNSASFTSWFIQPTATAPAAACIPTLGATASNVSALTCPTSVTATAFLSTTNCAAAGSAANPSVAACTAAPSGSFSCATNASTGTCQVNTTIVTANSRIFVMPSAAEGTNLSVTCNTSSDTGLTAPRLASKSAGASFTINLGTFTTNPLCFNYWIVN